MLTKAERDADVAILAAATPDWQQGHHVGEPKGLCSAQSPDESLLMLDKDGMAIFWKEADAAAAVTARNRLPVYIEAMAEMERLKTLIAETAQRHEKEAKGLRKKGNAAAAAAALKAAFSEELYRVLGEFWMGPEATKDFERILRGGK